LREKAEAYVFTLQQWHLTLFWSRMKRVEVKLGLPVVAPLLEYIKRTVGRPAWRTGCSPVVAGPGRGTRHGVEKRVLLYDQNEDCRRFLALFDSEFFRQRDGGF